MDYYHSWVSVWVREVDNVDVRKAKQDGKLYIFIRTGDNTINFDIEVWIALQGLVKQALKPFGEAFDTKVSKDSGR